jgi:hypothetical protein
MRMFGWRPPSATATTKATTVIAPAVWLVPVLAATTFSSVNLRRGCGSKK